MYSYACVLVLWSLANISFEMHCMSTLPFNSTTRMFWTIDKKTLWMPSHNANAMIIASQNYIGHNFRNFTAHSASGLIIYLPEIKSDLTNALTLYEHKIRSLSWWYTIQTYTQRCQQYVRIVFFAHFPPFICCVCLSLCSVVILAGFFFWCCNAIQFCSWTHSIVSSLTKASKK